MVKNFKTFWNKEYSYSGDPYDILNDKVIFFTNSAKGLCIPLSQLYGIFPLILRRRARDYFTAKIGRNCTFRTIYFMLKEHFDTKINKQQYYTDWYSMDFQTVRSDPANAGKSNMEMLQIFFDKMQKC